ncbi:MAG: DEAD/DEAH box helicase [Myxococcota bacterium]
MLRVLEPELDGKTIEDLLPGKGLRLRASELRDRLQDVVQSFLHYAAYRRRLNDWRRDAWQVDPEEPAMGELRATLLRAREEIADEPNLPQWHGNLFEDPPAYRLQAQDQSVELSLGNWEQGELPVTVEDVEDPTPHARWILEELLDVIADPHDYEHDMLRELLAVPMWSRLVRQIDTAVPPPEPEVPAERSRIGWRIALATFEVEPVFQKLGRRGRWTKGQRRSARWILEKAGAAATTPDRYIAAEIVAGEFGRAEFHLDDARPGPHLWPVLEQLASHPLVYVDDGIVPTRIRFEQLSLALRQLGSGYGIRVSFGGRLLTPKEAKESYRGSSVLWHHDTEQALLGVKVLSEAEKALLDVLVGYELHVPRSALDRLVASIVQALPTIAIELPESYAGNSAAADGQLVLRVVPRPTEGAEVAIGVRPTDRSELLTPGMPPRSVVALDDGVPTAYARDLDQETVNAEALAAQLGIGAPFGTAAKHVVPSNDQLLELLERAQGHARIEWPEGETAREVVGAVGDVQLRVTRLETWLGVEGTARIGDGKRKAEVRLKDLLQVRRSGGRFIALGQGRYARITDDLRQRLDAALPAVFEDGKNLGVGLANARELLALSQDQRAIDGRKHIEELLARRTESEALTIAPPSGLQAELRDYQQTGYQWLGRLSAWGLGGILADDMGLGKTLQALALLLRRAEQGPALVVAPTSVVDNWCSETERFAPALTPQVYRGKGRESLLEEIGNHTLLVTSYDIVLRDGERLAEQRFATLVLDEAQAIKNPASKRAGAVHGLTADFRVALTGTPIENRISELWSIFHAVQPGLLGSWRHFREIYAKPIERDSDPHALTQLRSRIEPFVLRRTKAEVAPELPQRTEVTHRIQLSREERALYDSARREAIQALGDVRAGEPGSRIQVLAELTKLRQLACHPRLVDPNSGIESTKLTHVRELSRDLLVSHHRSLIFSQFTRHLALVREAFDADEVPYLYLDGSTPAARRKRLVAAFQAKEAPFFLISLKAGGTGLNLTAADYVIHLDPWWNPAVEDQASDRAHRIGQTQPVTVVRLVSEGTIEETVYGLHGQKRQLAKDVLAGRSAPTPLTTEDLVELVRG